MEHDLDGTPLPIGHQEYTEEQERFSVLWGKWRDGTVTAEEKAEMLKLQEKYWDHKHDRIYEDIGGNVIPDRIKANEDRYKE